MERTNPSKQGIELAHSLLMKELDKDLLHPRLGTLLAHAFKAAHEALAIRNNLETQSWQKTSM